MWFVFVWCHTELIIPSIKQLNMRLKLFHSAGARWSMLIQLHHVLSIHLFEIMVDTFRWHYVDWVNCFFPESGGSSTVGLDNNISKQINLLVNTLTEQITHIVSTIIYKKAYTIISPGCYMSFASYHTALWKISLFIL